MQVQTQMFISCPLGAQVAGCAHHVSLLALRHGGDLALLSPPLCSEGSALLLPAGSARGLPFDWFSRGASGSKGSETVMAWCGWGTCVLGEGAGGREANWEARGVRLGFAGAAVWCVG